MTFYWTTGTLVFSVVVLLAAVVCCWISWRRSGSTRRMGVLELLRFALICLVLVTLNQPEVVEEIQPDEQPTLAILHDESGSMETKDVLNPDLPADPPKQRSEAVQQLLLPEIWKPIETEMQVRTEPFSSELPEPAEGTNLHRALTQTLEKHPNLRGIVLLSDGDWNTGTSPTVAATRLRVRKVPVFAVAVGGQQRLPDIELVSLDVPTFGVVGKPIRVPFLVQSSLPRDYEVTITLTATNGDEVRKAIRVPGMGRLQETIEWRPEKKGDYSLTLRVPQDETEILDNNNALTVPIAIRNEELRVLIVESYPRWEYRYLRNALERDPGVIVHCLLFHPDYQDVGDGRGYLPAFPSEQELFKYDVVFLGDVGVEATQLSNEQCDQLRQLVRGHAGGLVFLPGFRGRQSTLLTTKLGELCPVVLDPAQPRGWGSPRPAQFVLTESGRRSLLTRLEVRDEENARVWRSLPGFQWYAAALRAKAGSTVLATHQSESTRFGRVPLIVTRTSGTGKVLFMGTDGAWRWRKGVEDLYHYRFWGQVVRWMAYQRNMSQGKSMRLFYSPDRPQAGDVVTLNANVMTQAGEPLQQGTVVVQVVSPSGQTDSVRLAPAGEDTWGLFTGSFTPEEGGAYKLVTSCAEASARLETTLTVRGQQRERRGQPARHDVLREIAEVSRGRLAKVHEIKAVLADIAALPEPDPIVRRLRLWSHPLWGATIVLLLGIFWTGRKIVGVA